MLTWNTLTTKLRLGSLKKPSCLDKLPFSPRPLKSWTRLLTWAILLRKPGTLKWSPTVIASTRDYHSTRTTKDPTSTWNTVWMNKVATMTSSERLPESHSVWVRHYYLSSEVAEDSVRALITFVTTCVLHRTSLENSGCLARQDDQGVNQRRPIVVNPTWET